MAREIVPQEVQDAIEAGALITGGAAGVFSLASLALSTAETGDPLGTIQKEVGVTDLEKGLTKAERMMR